jgi:hypothetical protein
MKVKAAKCNLHHSFVGLLIGLWNVFTDGEGETKGEREMGGKRKENNILMNSVRKIRVKFGESF